MKRILFLIGLFSSFSIYCFTQDAASIRFSLTDNAGNAVSDLLKTDLSLLEGKNPLAIASLEPLKDKPVAATIMIDNSLSQEGVLLISRTFAARIVQDILRKDDLVSVMSFSGGLRELTPVAGNSRDALNAIEKIQVEVPQGMSSGRLVIIKPSGSSAIQGATGIWDSLIAAGAKGYNGRDDYRRVIFLITDGVNTSGTKKIEDAVEELNKAGITVYAIGIGDEHYSGVDKNKLKKIAELTGGKAFILKLKIGDKDMLYVEDKEMFSVMNNLKQRVSSEYLLTFTVDLKNEDKSGRLKLLIADPQKKKLYDITYPERYYLRK
jgi:VWFA-related protein